jgi:hypothetical protein
MQSAIDARLCQQSPGRFIPMLPTGDVLAAPCKKWSCPACGPRAARRFIARVQRTPRFTYFITLTSKPGQGSVNRQSVKNFNACWRSFAQWLKREVGLNHVTWTLEQGEKTGHLHRHALIDTNRSFSYKRARAALVRTGHGAVCDFKPSRSARSVQAGARYLGKYLGKSLSDQKHAWPRYTRRCQTSTPAIPSPPSQYKFIATSAFWPSAPRLNPIFDRKRMPRMLPDGDPRVLFINSLESQRKTASEETPHVRFLDKIDAHQSP